MTELKTQEVNPIPVEMPLPDKLITAASVTTAEFDIISLPENERPTNSEELLKAIASFMRVELMRRYHAAFGDELPLDSMTANWTIAELLQNAVRHANGPVSAFVRQNNDGSLFYIGVTDRNPDWREDKIEEIIEIIEITIGAETQSVNDLITDEKIDQPNTIPEPDDVNLLLALSSLGYEHYRGFETVYESSVYVARTPNVVLGDIAVGKTVYAVFKRGAELKQIPIFVDTDI